MLVQAAWSRLQTLAVMRGVSSAEQRAPASSLSGHVADGLDTTSSPGAELLGSTQRAGDCE